jgi:HK97 family phage prohead protease
VKQESDGSYTTIGCHESKQDAIDQMVVVSMSEDIDPIGDVSSRSLDDLLEPEIESETETETEIEPESELLPRQAALYEMYEKVSEVFGMWNQGGGADGAHYVAESPFAADGLICANCVFYEGGRGCEIVAGDIAPAGICKLWVISERLVTESVEPEESSMGYEARDEIRCADETAPTMIEPMSTLEQVEHRWCITGADERRVAYTTLEMREDVAGNRLVGYAAVFDSPSEPMPFTEYVKRGAFQKTIKDGADVRLLIDHEGVPLARTKSGTLMLEEDERGLKVMADLDPLNPDAARVISAMRRGDMTQMSFAFRTIKDSWSADRSVRELREVQLFDVSVVTFPAYEATVAELRNANTATTISPTTSVSVRKAQIALARQR